MNWKALAALTLALGLFAASAGAATLGGPATGLWANPNDGGRGFNIDIQGDTMIVTTFVYQQNGAPIWYLSSGIYNHKTGVFTSSYDSFSNGQCFGCVPRNPDVHSGAAGPMRIEFRDNQHATITTPAGRLSIQKFNYGFPTPTDILYGAWGFTMNGNVIYTSDWVYFNKSYRSGGEVYAQGTTIDAGNRLALGQYVSASVGTLILVESGSYYHAYQVDLDDRRGMGRGWVYLKTSTPRGDGSLAMASRITFKGELDGKAAAAAGPKSAPIDPTVDALQAGDEAGSAPPPAEIEAKLLDMMAAMERKAAN
ncbi:hypothetical protein [Dokdonella sp.]|uniref:hypothetical protein n=1 Tax=Dokdonella sp. TaxID=2291710 RepID=UPI0031C6E0AF|nr:hypothetical protein [Dokdonella sp.]